MNVMRKWKTAYRKDESGAALVTVLFISLLLLTASVAMLTAVGYNSKNTSDVLSETKAYYAAETGLQATVNVLRNSVDGSTPPRQLRYSDIVAGPADLSTWLPPYVNGQVPIGTGTGYSIQVSNPDNTGTVITYQTEGKWLSPGNGIRTGNMICVPNCNPETTTRTEMSFTPVPTTTPTSQNTLVGTFTINKPGGGAAVVSGVTFRIDYRILTPRIGVASIYGTITQNDATSPIRVTFQSRDYSLLGSTMQLCENLSSGCPIPNRTLSITGSAEVPFYSSFTSSFSPTPYRLKVISTGYGPNGAVKQIEAIVRRDLFDGYDAPATMALIGPNSDNLGGFVYNPGTSANVTYSGGDCINGRCIPSFAVTDQLNLNYIINNTPNNVTLAPEPRVVDFDILPSWLQSPAALETVIRRLRITAQHSDRYFPSGTNVPNLNSTSGTGITFCEGSCSVTGTGSGLLVVTGQLTATGNFNFTGLILVIGQEGMVRTGGGSGDVSGNIIIAPYNRPPYTYPYPSGQMSTTFLTPRYNISGGGGSVVPLADISFILDSTAAVSDIVAGVAEK